MYIIDKEGNKMFDVNKYQFVYGFMGGICYVEDANGECGVINKEGKLIPSFYFNTTLDNLVMKSFIIVK